MSAQHRALLHQLAKFGRTPRASEHEVEVEVQSLTFFGLWQNPVTFTQQKYNAAAPYNAAVVYECVVKLPKERTVYVFFLKEDELKAATSETLSMKLNPALTKRLRIALIDTNGTSTLCLGRFV